MSESLIVIFSSFWTFAGTAILLLICGLSVALTLYWLTLYREMKEEVRQRQKAEAMYNMVKEINREPPPFN